MASDDVTPESDIDLDEDLFNFDEVEEEAGNDLDLDDIFASFNDKDFDPPEGFDEEINLGSMIAAEDALGDDAHTGVTTEAAPPAAEAAEAAPLQAAPAAVAPQVAGTPVPSVLTPEGALPAGVVYAQPMAAPAAVQVAAGPTKLKVSPAILLILAAITATNGLVALVAIKSSNDVRNSIAQVGANVSELSNETQDLAQEASEALREAEDPHYIGVDPDKFPSLSAIEDTDVQSGDYARARQRIYSVLSILDRRDPSRRLAVESQATYMLGKIRYMEALQRLAEGEQ